MSFLCLSLADHFGAVAAVRHLAGSVDVAVCGARPRRLAGRLAGLATPESSVEKLFCRLAELLSPKLKRPQRSHSFARNSMNESPSTQGGGPKGTIHDVGHSLASQTGFSQPMRSSPSSSAPPLDHIWSVRRLLDSSQLRRKRNRFALE